jgi:hypothetical protein
MHFPAIQAALDALSDSSAMASWTCPLTCTPRHDTGKSNDRERGTATIESRHH